MKQLELQSQQLVDILLQLGFVKIESLFSDEYLSDELNVYWENDGYGDCVFNMYGNAHNETCIKTIDGESIATNIAYFQKQLDKKLNQESQNASN